MSDALTMHLVGAVRLPAAHAERIREAERAVVEACTKWRTDGPVIRSIFDALSFVQEPKTEPLTEAMVRAVDILLALRAETCPTCGGTGGEWLITVCGDDEMRDFVACPANCDNGRRRDA